MKATPRVRPVWLLVCCSCEALSPMKSNKFLISYVCSGESVVSNIPSTTEKLYPCHDSKDINSLTET